MAKKRSRQKAAAGVRAPARARSSQKSGKLFWSKWRPSRRWLEASDLIALGLYLAFVSIVALPGIRHGIDPIHQPALLMSSLRILSGQVPFRDFYPWYGPLYHHFLAAWVWISGRDLLSIKLFLSLISPLVSMVLLIAALRAFRLTWPARLFGVMATAVWGVERLYHCGSTRSLLGLFLLGAWAQAIRAPAAGRARTLIFPSILLALFYSPEVGFYLVPAAILFLIGDLLQLDPASRKGSLLDYVIGGGAAGLLFALLYFGTTATKTYLQFSVYVSANMLWAYGRPKPSWKELLAVPRSTLYFLPLVMLLPALLWTADKLRRRQGREIPTWLPALVVFGGLLWNTTYSVTTPDHLLFSLPPIMALMAWYFQGRTRFHWHQLALLLLIIWGAPFFRLSRLDACYWTNRFSATTWRTTAPFGRIYLKPEAVDMLENIKRFSDSHPNETIFFPLHSSTGYWAGRPFLLPVEDLFLINEPTRNKEFMDRIIQANAAYICLDVNHRYESYMHEDLDELFDYIAGYYRPIQAIRSIVIYARNPEPKPVAQPIQDLPASVDLGPQDGFSVTWEVPPDLGSGYIQLQEKCFYRFGILQRFSLPLLQIYLDGIQVQWPWPDNGRQRLRTTPAGGETRILLPTPTRQVKIKVTFPGVLNLPPERIEVSQVRFYKFNSRPFVPYTLEFMR